MDVKAFIFEATDKSLKIDAAIREVDAAKEAVEAARAAVEAAKAGVEAAKQGVVAAKEELDTYAERAEEFGLTRSKFKDAVERMKTLLTDIGAVESGSAETSEAAVSEPKQKAPRKRKGPEAAEQTTEQATQQAEGESLQETASRIANNPAVIETLSPFETEVADLAANDEILVAELTDPVSIAAAAAAAARHAEWPAVNRDQTVATVVEPSTPAASADEAVVADAPVEAPAAATVEIEEIANIFRREPETVVVGETKGETVIAEVAKVVEAHTTTSTAAATEEVEDELDNSIAEQELLDFVDEVGTSDDDVKAVLSAAIKVVSWHTTNVAKAALRTQPSPLTLAGVLVVEDAGYTPKDIQDAYKVALSFGGEKLTAAISWFNKSLDLLADAKPVEDFRFSEPVKATRAKKEEPAVEPAPAPEEAAPAVTVVETQDSVSNDALDEVIDATEAGSDVAETIEDMQLFSAPEAEDEAPEAPAPEVAKPEEKPAASLPPKISKPSWLK
ncbi:hypothetical protein OIU34_16980 [Pararhizobium sp. BT-229]|uniref:hypothetical protein n=1 Tax=Pararhizobium sp. BT-229 TaxID=2986923 RepID=UPI0021F6D537|nr:hypothetical protein [Pararhizobium sp. BT-229]MCV9963595.1 hypothetical protein [Pararhizobium sp. BT-229]